MLKKIKKNQKKNKKKKTLVYVIGSSLMLVKACPLMQ